LGERKPADPTDRAVLAASIGKRERKTVRFDDTEEELRAHTSMSSHNLLAGSDTMRNGAFVDGAFVDGAGAPTQEASVGGGEQKIEPWSSNERFRFGAVYRAVSYMWMALLTHAKTLPCTDYRGVKALVQAFAAMLRCAPVLARDSRESAPTASLRCVIKLVDLCEEYDEQKAAAASDDVPVTTPLPDTSEALLAMSHSSDGHMHARAVAELVCVERILTSVTALWRAQPASERLANYAVDLLSHVCYTATSLNITASVAATHDATEILRVALAYVPERIPVASDAPHSAGHDGRTSDGGEEDRARVMRRNQRRRLAAEVALETLVHFADAPARIAHLVENDMLPLLFPHEGDLLVYRLHTTARPPPLPPILPATQSPLSLSSDRFPAFQPVWSPAFAFRPPAPPRSVDLSSLRTPSLSGFSSISDVDRQSMASAHRDDAQSLSLPLSSPSPSPCGFGDSIPDSVTAPATNPRPRCDRLFLLPHMDASVTPLLSDDMFYQYMLLATAVLRHCPQQHLVLLDQQHRLLTICMQLFLARRTKRLTELRHDVLDAILNSPYWTNVAGTRHHDILQSLTDTPVSTSRALKYETLTAGKILAATAHLRRTSGVEH
jgi:hypothetical protein